MWALEKLGVAIPMPIIVGVAIASALALIVAAVFSIVILKQHFTAARSRTVLAAILMVGGGTAFAVGLYLTLSQRETSVEVAAATTTEPLRAYLTATNKGKIGAKEMVISGTPPNFPFANADREGEIDMSGSLWTAPDAPTRFPTLPGEISRPDTELRHEIRAIRQELRSFQADFDAEMKETRFKQYPDIPTRVAALRTFSEKYKKRSEEAGFPA